MFRRNLTQRWRRIPAVHWVVLILMALMTTIGYYRIPEYVMSRCCDDLDQPVFRSNVKRKLLAHYHSTSQEQRHDGVLRACKRLQDSDRLRLWPDVADIPDFPNDPIISTKHNLLYCPVGKVASTFFTRWIIAMAKPGPMQSPYYIPIQDAGREKVESLSQLRPKAVQGKFLNSSVRMVFGRNPYSRLFSAYIEKLFRPNPYYWNQWGKKAMGLKPADNQSASKVPFPLYVNVAVEKLVQTDKHLRPIHLECNMCQMYYDVIGKLETQAQDLDHVSNLIQVPSHFQHEDVYNFVAHEDSVVDTLEKVYKFKSHVEKCIFPDEMGRRIWRELEIRGYIDSAIGYPFSPGEIETLPLEVFIKVARGAAWSSQDVRKLKRQKRQAMEELYLTLTSSQIEDIQRVYSGDFSIFGYSAKPDYLFDSDYRATIKQTGVLDWTKPWVLASED